MENQRSIWALALARLFLNIPRRFAYPFLPRIARELDVSLSSVQNVVAVQAGIGIASPAFSSLAERYGRKRVMLGCLLLLIAASFPAILLPRFGVFYAVMVVFGFAKVIFDPAMQAYIGDRVPYQQRALAIGITELAWAGSLMVAAPLTGRLLDAYNLQAVFQMILVTSVLAVGLVWWFVPADVVSERRLRPFNPLHDWNILRKSPAALAALAFSLLFVAANEALYIVYGAWMEETFNLKLVALGTATIVIAAAEVLGEFSVIGLADRVGKRRLMLLGGLLASAMYAGLPALSFHLSAALAGLFLLFVGVEIAIVASISIFTEVLPQARAIMMSGNVAAHSIGRFTGATIGSLVYANASFGVTGLVSAILGLAAVGVLWRYIVEA